MAEKLKKVLVFDSNKCTGCRTYELTCSMGHFEELNHSKSYFKILKHKERDLNIAAPGIKCDYCEDCIRWCLPGAIKFMALEEAYVSSKDKI